MHFLILKAIPQAVQLSERPRETPAKLFVLFKGENRVSRELKTYKHFSNAYQLVILLVQ